MRNAHNFTPATSISLAFNHGKPAFPDKLTDFLNSGDYGGFQPYTDNEIRRYKLKPMRNSCEERRGYSED